jgi:hypothetical protein
MEYAGLLIGVVALLIANITAFPAFSRRYPDAAARLNFTSSVLNSANGLIAVFVYKFNAAAVMLTPSAGSGNSLRASFAVALIGSAVSGAAGLATFLEQEGSLKIFGATVAIISILTIVRLAHVLVARTYETPAPAKYVERMLNGGRVAMVDRAPDESGLESGVANRSE